MVHVVFAKVVLGEVRDVCWGLLLVGGHFRRFHMNILVCWTCGMSEDCSTRMSMTGDVYRRSVVEVG